MKRRMARISITLLGVMLLLAMSGLKVQAQVALQDSLALVALYNATDGANWANNTNWLTGPVSKWFGVTVTRDRVTKLRLRRNQLTGSIPGELGNLANLTDLRLGHNQLTGSIPVELGNLTNLRNLNFSVNQLTGSIPVGLGNLTKLTYLSLFDNQLTGSIPGELGNLGSLTVLGLGSNQLTGSIPPELGNLTNLTFLSFASNPLSGTLPLSLTKLFRLDRFWFENTTLCEPIDGVFQLWLQGISDVRRTGCTNVATEEAAEIPAAFALEANYPNPFNPTTRIRYALPQRAPVRLLIYDVQGRRVAVLVASEQPAGRYEVGFEAGALPSGVYFYRLEAGVFRAVRQMLLLR